MRRNRERDVDVVVRKKGERNGESERKGDSKKGKERARKERREQERKERAKRL
jgi:hypothetical protein